MALLSLDDQEIAARKSVAPKNLNTDRQDRPAGQSEELRNEYRRRFGAAEHYRETVWARLMPFFQGFIASESAVLDLGCGYGEFINPLQAKTKYAMDLNPDAGTRLDPDVRFFLHDCSLKWPLEPESLDVIFTSNFFEHLPTKEKLSDTINNAVVCLKPNGRLISLGPNARYLPGAYWDFWDHHIALSDQSLSELLELRGLRISKVWKRFLPYTMSLSFKPPAFLVDLYLRLPWIWPFIGRQFLIIAQK
jgi:SAM-dependent methyltransferase